MRHLAIVEYDGTDFSGFQRQAEGLPRTVQGEIERALSQIGWTGRSILAAGRTDAGVHAAGQVIAFDLEWVHGEPSLLRALNANLPGDVAVRTVQVAAPEFHPRFDARARRYCYTLYNAPVRSPLQDRYAWHVWQPLEVARLQAASAGLLGTQDFATFGLDPDDGTNTIRTILQADWRMAQSNVYFDIQADAFLYRMVRSLVGALKLVGTGEMPAAEFEARLRARDRAQCPPPAPASGLCLMEVVY